MHRILTVLAPALMLVCCDKPASDDSSAADSASTRRTAGYGDGKRPRDLVEETPNTLRMKLGVAMKIESSQERDKAMAEIAWNAMEIEPEIAHESLGKLSVDSPERLRIIRHYAMRLAEQNPEEAVEWADSLGSETEISAAMSHIALEIAETDPVRAANLLSEAGLAGRDFDVAVVQVIQRWAGQSPPDAGAWVSSFPPGAAREAGIKVIVEQWLPRNARAAFDWFDSLRGEKLRQETARAMEGVIIQQPRDIQDAWLHHADVRIRSDLEQQREQAIRDVGDNIPPTLNTSKSSNGGAPP